MTRIVALGALAAEAREALAVLTLPAAREHAPEWMDSLDDARATIAEALAPEVIALVLVDEAQHPMAWIAAAPAWGRVWELHPLIVAVDQQRRGHGRALVAALEERVAAQGALTMMLGTGDSTRATSLGGVDLYDDTFVRLAAATVNRAHALEFWRRVGYQIVGVIPDAEGPGQPSITLAKRLTS